MAMAKKSNSSKHKKAAKKMLSYLLWTFNLGFQIFERILSKIGHNPKTVVEAPLGCRDLKKLNDFSRKIPDFLRTCDYEAPYPWNFYQRHYTGIDHYKYIARGPRPLLLRQLIRRQ